MKKYLFLTKIIAFAFVVISLSSCLKDSSYVNLSQGGAISEFPAGGSTFFSADAITAAGPLDTIKFAVNIASPSIPTSATSVTVGVDNTIVTSYDAANPAIAYLTFPAAAFKFPDQTVTIPGGSRTSILTLIVDRSQLDPTKSYMLPIVIKSAPGTTISGNMSIHYYHIIGNDFAGTYKWDYTRVPASGNFVGNSTVLSPVSPSQFETTSGYYTQTERYEVTFTKNSDGTYSNFQVSINADDVANIFTPAGIAITSQPQIISLVNGQPYNATTHYTYAQATSGFFTFQYQVLGGSGARTVTDKFYK